LEVKLGYGGHSDLITVAGTAPDSHRISLYKPFGSP